MSPAARFRLGHHHIAPPNHEKLEVQHGEEFGRRFATDTNTHLADQFHKPGIRHRWRMMTRVLSGWWVHIMMICAHAIHGFVLHSTELKQVSTIPYIFHTHIPSYFKISNLMASRFKCFCFPKALRVGSPVNYFARFLCQGEFAIAICVLSCKIALEVLVCGGQIFKV